MIMKKTLLNECIAEALGTFLFVLIGIASVAILVATETAMTYWELAIVWGLSVSLGIYCTAHISGAHLNPAVTISLVAWKKFPIKKMVPYIFSQIIGAFLAAACDYGLFRSTIISYEQTEGIIRSSSDGAGSAVIFATFPGANVSLVNAFFVEFTITMILMLVIYAVTDANNDGAPIGGLGALIIGMTVGVCGLAFGALTGFAMNPARDFGPRLFTLITGWGSTALGPNLYGLIVPILGPICGAIFAGAIYFKVLVPYYQKDTNNVIKNIPEKEMVSME